MGQREPESKLQGPKVSFRATLGPNLGCQSQPRQPELENTDFPYVLYDSCQKHQFYAVFLRVRVTKYCKLHAYMRGRSANTGATPFDSALQIDRENPFSVNTDWGIMHVFWQAETTQTWSKCDLKLQNWVSLVKVKALFA